MTAPTAAQASRSLPLLPDGSISASDNLSGFATLVRHQATVLGLSDSWLMLTGFAACLLVLTIILPRRVWPPQTLIQPHPRNK